MMTKEHWMIVTFAVMGSACGGAPKPVDQLASAEGALRAAREVGAAEDPQAQLHAKLAEEQLARAQTLIGRGNNAQAEGLLLRARADAEYALALERKAKAEQALSRVESTSRNVAEK